MALRNRQDNLAQNEETLFSLQFSIVLIEHLRLISRALHSWHKLTLNEYCTIAILEAYKKPASCTMLYKYLILHQGTMLAILTDLEEKGIIDKRADTNDGRAMLVSLTIEGKELARMLSDQVLDLMRQTFWSSMHLTEVFSPLVGFRAQLEQLRGYPMPPISDSVGGRSNRNLTQAMVFRIVNIVVELWTRSIRDYANLSLNEGRILILLELYGSLNPSDITRKLYIAPSNVAVLCAQLCQQGLLEALVDIDDARRKNLRCTAVGLRLARELLSILRKTTRDCYISYTDSAIIIFNAQHMRMYCELDKVRLIEQTILSE